MAGGRRGDRGSSPLTRGKLLHVVRAVRADGLIPAHAGKTCPLRRRAGTWSAHPRSRGENAGLLGSDAGTSGSSPLTRGKPRRMRNDSVRPRLIPAHAGKTHETPTKKGSSGAHPRSRGENNDPVDGCAEEGGSSPLTRGKRDLRLRGRLPGRLIPAHAGKTTRSMSAWIIEAAHPRSRGENSVRGAPATSVGGSSPLTRGKPTPVLGARLRVRLIPAHAGKTTSWEPSPSPTQAHPRSRGENT